MLTIIQKRSIPNSYNAHLLSLSADTLVISCDAASLAWDLRSDQVVEVNEGWYYNAYSPCGKYHLKLRVDQADLQVVHLSSGAIVYAGQSTSNRLRRTPFRFQRGRLWFGLYDGCLSSIDLDGTSSAQTAHTLRFTAHWMWEEIVGVGADRLALIGYPGPGERSDWQVLDVASIAAFGTDTQLEPRRINYEMADGFALADADGTGLYVLRDFGDAPSQDPDDMEWNGLAYVDPLNTVGEKRCPIDTRGQLSSGAPMLVGEHLVAVGLKSSIEIYDRKDGRYVTRFDVDRNKARFGFPPIYTFDLERLRFAFLREGQIQVIGIS